MKSFEERVRGAVADNYKDKNEVSAIIDMIRDSRKIREVIGWPGRESIKVKMRLLTVAESRKAKVENQLEFKKDGIEVTGYNLVDYKTQEAVHGLWRVFLDAETDEPIFNSAEHMRQFCTDDELTALCNAYNAFSEKNDPNMENMSEEDAKRLIDLLKKTPLQIQSKVVSLPVAWKLLRILVAPQPN